MSDIVNAITERISGQCHCSYTARFIIDSQLFCDDNKLIYQAEFLGTSRITSNDIRSLTQEWVFSQPLLAINSQLYNLDTSCSVVVETPGRSSCDAFPPTTASTSLPEATLRSPSAFELAAVAGVAVILFVLGTVVVCLVVFFIVKRSKKTSDEDRDIRYEIQFDSKHVYGAVYLLI